MNSDYLEFTVILKKPINRIFSKNRIKFFTIILSLKSPSRRVSEGKMRKGLVVAPSEPRVREGLYWGYSVRLASNLSGVFTGSPYSGGYDVTIGTSERGDDVDEYRQKKFK